MNRIRRKFFLLASPTYLAAVWLLLLNDFVMKKAYPGWITGKLSDFAGLFALSVFALIVLPRLRVLFAIATLFVFWKSSFSELFIGWWNSVTDCTIGRTVDYTDLTAIGIIPLAWIFYQRATERELRRGLCLVSSCISLFAFCATSRTPTPEQQAAFHAAVSEYKFTDKRPTYLMPFGRKELYTRIEALGFVVSGATGIYPDFDKHTAYIFPRPLPHWTKLRTGRAELFEAVFDVDNAPTGVAIRVTKIEVKRGVEPTNKYAAVKMFEERVIQPLRLHTR